MTGASLPVTDHVGRYCKPSTVEDEVALATAFMLREMENGLSVNWLEFLADDRGAQISLLHDLYKNKFRNVSANARIAVLNVGQVISEVQNESEDGRVLEIIHTPFLPGTSGLTEDPSHAEVINMRPDEELIAEIIAECVHESLYPPKPPQA